MLSKATVKLVSELKHKKCRQESGLFVVEGTKLVAELLASKISVKSLFATAQWIDENQNSVSNNTELVMLTENQLEHLSLQQSPQQVLSLAHLPKTKLNESEILKEFSIALDTIQDPGNLGTIIRIADWYGIKNILCSTTCADVYNPKVVQATMGSFLRVNMIYTSLNDFFEEHRPIVIGALMNGENLYEATLPAKGVLLIGNEGSGIHKTLMPYITNGVTIPKFGGAESLNAGIATAIICDNWARSNA
jgi:TrmH family RNA methyltransferase